MKKITQIKIFNSYFFQNLILILFVFLLGIFYINMNKIMNYKKQDKIIINQKNVIEQDEAYGIFPRQNYAFSNSPGDVLLNPYVPPLKDERYILDDRIFPGPRIPINIQTNIGANLNKRYRQIGILTSHKDKTKILPLMGQPVFSNRNKWNYYTSSEKNNIKLPVYRNKKSCLSDNGCDEIYSRDRVLVKGYNEFFEVELYDDNTMEYLPFI